MTGAMKLQPDDGPRSSLSIRPRFGRCSGISSKFAKRFAEGIKKLAGNMPGDHQKKTARLVVRMLEAAGFTGGTTFPKILAGKPLVSGGCTATAQVFGQLTCPCWAVELPIPRNLGTLGG
ncbi:hypothetical protein BHM03_00032668 [Ensete ventricosum]|uniref:Uncharacterized protein n=1 Tax=Ensete ventricosum TaxID=4639 RepID=A0A445MIS0_ENSVE|nr:hypothetical protein BHM03_00032668 [Ensete ventricosum]